MGLDQQANRPPSAAILSEDDMWLRTEILPLIPRMLWPILTHIGEGSHQASMLRVMYGGSQLGTSGETLPMLLEQGIRMGLICKDIVQGGGRGRPSHRYYVTDFGKAAYRAKFGLSLRHDDAERLRTRGSPEHGALIEHVAECLHAAGYVDIDADNKQTRRAVGDGRTVQFDIVARRTANAPWVYVECERGTHTDAEMHDKLDKAFAVASGLWIITPHAKALATVREQCRRWSGAAAGQQPQIFTLDQLRRGKCAMTKLPRRRKRS